MHQRQLTQSVVLDFRETELCKNPYRVCSDTAHFLIQIDLQLSAHNKTVSLIFPHIQVDYFSNIIFV